MKHLSFLSLMLLSLGTFAQNTTYVQPIVTAVHKVNADNNCTVTIVADTSDFVMVTPNMMKAGGSDADSMVAHLIRVAQQQISFSDEAMLYDIEVHLASDRLELYAKDNAEIIFKGSGGDTLLLQSFSAYATDIAKIKIQPFLKVASSIKLHYDDMGEIDHNGYSGGLDIIYDNSCRSDAVDCYSFQNNGPKQKGKDGGSYYYSNGDRTRLSFLWGWNNWGTSPLNGMLSVPGASELKTTFTSYQIYASYAFIARKHCEMSIGLGYESDKYNFKNALVQIKDGDFVTIDSPGNWINNFITRYVNVPIQLTYFSQADHDDCFGIGVAIVPGICVATKTKGFYVPDPDQLSDAHITEQSLHFNSYLNPVKCDVRIIFSFNDISFFIQPSLMPVFNNGFIDSERELWKRELFPFKIGFAIGL